MKLLLTVLLAGTAVATFILSAQAPAPAAAPAAVAGSQNVAPRLQQRAKRLAALKGQIAKALGLSATQKEQIKTIRQQARLTAQPVVAQLKQNRQDLTAAVKAGDATKIQALSKAQGELMGQALTIRSQALAQVYAGLTNDQRTKFEAMQARIQAKIAQRQANRALAN